MTCIALTGLFLSVLVVRYKRADERAAGMTKFGLNMEGKPLAGMTGAAAAAPQSYGATVRAAPLRPPAGAGGWCGSSCERRARARACAQAKRTGFNRVKTSMTEAD